jgi:hypothetical protein
MSILRDAYFLWRRLGARKKIILSSASTYGTFADTVK